MTLTFDSKVYSDLLLEHQPQIIKTEEDNEKFLGKVQGIGLAYV